jgi:hypothetical protein
LLILVGSAFSGTDEPAVNAEPAAQIIGGDDCCVPINCETGQPCTPEEVENCGPAPPGCCST